MALGSEGFFSPDGLQGKENGEGVGVSGLAGKWARREQTAAAPGSPLHSSRCPKGSSKVHVGVCSWNPDLPVLSCMWSRNSLTGSCSLLEAPSSVAG